MKETMGQIIKRLRKERNLTQEELAEQLGVTFQAVSKWENDNGMPDISQVVPLANLFGVSTDALFGRENLSVDEQVEKSIKKIEENANGNADQIFDGLTEALKEYPSHPKILYAIVRYAENLITADYSDRNYRILTTALKAADLYMEKSRKLGDLAGMLAKKIDLYAKAGRYAEAEELTKEFEMPIVSREMYLAHISNGRGDFAEEIRHKQESIAQILGFLADEIGNLAVAYRKNGELEKAVEVNMINLKLPYTIHGNGEFHAPLFNWYHISGFEAAYEMMLLGRDEDALDLLEKIFDYGERQCELCTNHRPVTSAVLDRIDLTPYHGELLVSDFLWKITYQDFEPLHKYERFQNLLERYGKYPQRKE